LKYNNSQCHYQGVIIAKSVVEGALDLVAWYLLLFSALFKLNQSTSPFITG